MAVELFNITLTRIETIAPGVKHFVFERTDKQPLPFIPGQFISIHLPGMEKSIKRSYSLATRQDTSQSIEFAASYVSGGIASEILFSMQPGDTLQAEGPYGRLTLRDQHPKRYIFVATGTGVTPYRSMLPLLHQLFMEQDLAVVLLQGVRHRADLLYADEFLTFAATHPQFTFQAYFSRETELVPLSHEHKGYVQESFESLALSPEHDIIYLCGNPGMVDDAYDNLQTRGFDSQSVRREKYISGK